MITRYFGSLRAGQIADADHALARFGQIAREVRVREWEWQQARLLAMRAFESGHIAEAAGRHGQEGQSTNNNISPAH